MLVWCAVLIRCHLLGMLVHSSVLLVDAQTGIFYLDDYL